MPWPSSPPKLYVVCHQTRPESARHCLSVQYNSISPDNVILVSDLPSNHCFCELPRGLTMYSAYETGFTNIIPHNQHQNLYTSLYLTTTIIFIDKMAAKALQRQNVLAIFSPPKALCFAQTKLEYNSVKLSTQSLRQTRTSNVTRNNPS